MFPGGGALRQTSGNVSVAPAPPKEMGAVGGYTLELRQALEHAHGRFTALEQRLSGVLRPPMPSASGAQDQARPPVSPIGEALRQDHDGVSALIQRINELIDRVDV